MHVARECIICDAGWFSCRHFDQKDVTFGGAEVFAPKDTHRTVYEPDRREVIYYCGVFIVKVGVFTGCLPLQ